MVKNEKWMYNPKEDEQFFFMHIPKTGGTTLRKMLTNHFPDGSYYPSQSDLINNKGKYFNQQELVQKKSILLSKSLIMGHYSVDLIDSLNPNVKTISFFRNPFDRVMSHVKHILNNEEKWKGGDPNDVIKHRVKLLGGTQTRMINDSNAKNLQDMLKNIDKLSFVGILEEFENSIKLLNSTFNWSFEIGKKENVSLSSISESITSKSMALICRNIKLDIIVYDYAYELFENRLEKL